jgi:hypothetical protein
MVRRDDLLLKELGRALEMVDEVLCGLGSVLM